MMMMMMMRENYCYFSVIRPKSGDTVPPLHKVVGTRTPVFPVSYAYEMSRHSWSNNERMLQILYTITQRRDRATLQGSAWQSAAECGWNARAAIYEYNTQGDLRGATGSNAQAK